MPVRDARPLRAALLQETVAMRIEIASPPVAARFGAILELRVAQADLVRAEFSREGTRAVIANATSLPRSRVVLLVGYEIQSFFAFSPLDHSRTRALESLHFYLIVIHSILDEMT
jgi:hypothetical protein